VVDILRVISVVASSTHVSNVASFVMVQGFMVMCYPIWGVCALGIDFLEILLDAQRERGYMVGVSKEVRMGDYASVYMVQLEDAMFMPLRNAILLACKEYVGDHTVNNVDVAYVQKMAASTEKAAKLSDLHNAGEGTLVCVNGIWFVRSSRYACCSSDDVWADIINCALDSIDAKKDEVIEIYY